MNLSEVGAELSVADLKLVQAKMDLEDTRSKLSVDEKFLVMLNEKCQLTERERKNTCDTHQLEMEVVSKALITLSSDEAHDTFIRTFLHAPLQMK